MFRRTRTPGRDWHIVDSGRVACPLRGDLDTDHCVSCPHLVDLAEDADASYIVCRPPVSVFAAPTGFGTGI